MVRFLYIYGLKSSLNPYAGVEELVTPPLTRGDILPGITRDSIISLVRETEDLPVREGNIKMKDLSQAVKEGRLFEAFGSGTAAIITPISVIHYKGEVISCILCLSGHNERDIL